LNFTDLIAVINNIKRLIILINLFYLMISPQKGISVVQNFRNEGGSY
jgi:hypothetical protein